MISADHLYPHAFSHVGHKGLIFDRLDVGVADFGYGGSFTPGMFTGSNTTEFDTPRLVPFAKGIYHNRNRAYMPELGRFAQADPNASGMGRLDLPVYHGIGFRPSLIAFDAKSRYGDGGSLYGYLRGNPLGASDAMGLFTFLDLLAGSTSAIDLQTDWMQDILQFGIGLKRDAQAFIGAGAQAQMHDLEWASDWSARDDDYLSRGTWRIDDENPADIDSISDWGTSPNPGQFDVALLTGLAKHHPLPKFLGGSLSRAAKYVEKVKNVTHVLFHKRLIEELKTNEAIRNIIKTGGNKGRFPSRERWRDFLTKNPHLKGIVKEKLMRTTDEVFAAVPAVAKKLKEQFETLDHWMLK